MAFTYRGKRYRESTETEDRKLAQRIYDKVKGEIAEGKWFGRQPGEDKTFENMIEKFTEENIPERSNTVYKSILRTLSRAFNGPLNSITPNVVNKFKKDLRDKGEKSASINHKIRILKRMFNVAITEWEWFKDNPIASVHLLGKEDRRERWINLEEEDRILSHSPGWLKEIVTFALNTGLRIGEIVDLSWNNVDLFRKTLTVVRPKNNEPRTIPMNATVFRILKDKSKVRSLACDKVFQVNGKAFKKNYIQVAFKQAFNRADIIDLHFHDLRHSFATRLVQSGEDLYKIQILLGHKSPLMTQRYAHHYPESLRGSVEVLDGLDTKMTHLFNERV
jgi:integrase